MNKKILALVFTVFLLFVSTALCGADEFSSGESPPFGITEVVPDNRFILEHDINGDRQYINDIIYPYTEKYVVTREEYIDCSDIDKYFSAISTPLTLEEIDKGSYKTKYENVYLSPERKRQYNTLKVAGSFGGITAEFEPLVYYQIYRKTAIIGGYIKYRYEYEDPAVAQWLCCENLQNLTKELVGNDLRITLLNSITDLINFSKNDNKMVVAVLQDGKLDSLYEKEDVIHELEEISTAVGSDLNLEL